MQAFSLGPGSLILDAGSWTSYAVAQQAILVILTFSQVRPIKASFTEESYSSNDALRRILAIIPSIFHKLCKKLAINILCQQTLKNQYVVVKGL
jgi:hypothetical protein